MTSAIWANIDAGNCLLPDGTKPLHKLILFLGYCIIHRKRIVIKIVILTEKWLKCIWKAHKSNPHLIGYIKFIVL